MRTRGGGSAALAGVAPPPAHQAVDADQAPLTLLQLPDEVLVLLLGRLDARSLARVAATCSELYRDKPPPMMSPVEEVLRQRAAARGHECPDRLRHEFFSWAAHLARLDRRREEAWAPVAAGSACSFFAAEGGLLMSCGTGSSLGMLGLRAREVEALVVQTPMPAVHGGHPHQ